MKKLTGGVIILIIALAGGYYGMGVVTENTIKRNIEVINKSNGLTAELTQYKRGFFTSSAKINWNLHVPERVAKDTASGQPEVVAAQDYQMELPLSIKHGPIMLADNKLRFGMGYAQSEIKLPDSYAQQLDMLFTKESTKPVVDLSIFVNYLNRSTIALNVPAFKLMAKEGGGQIEWLGLDFSTTISDKVDKVDGELVIKGLQATKDDFKVVLKKVSSDYNLHQTTAGLLLGDAQFSMPSLMVTQKDKTLFEITELSMHSSSDVKNDLFSTTLNFSLKSLVANNQTFGPGDLKLALRNLDANVLAKLNEKASEMQNATELQRQQALLGLLPELPKLLGKGPQLELSQLSLKLPMGLVKGNLMISMPKAESNNPLDLIKKVEGQAKFEVSAAVLKHYTQQANLVRLASQPLLKVETLRQMKEEAKGNQTEPALEQMATWASEKQIQLMEKTGLIKAAGDNFVLEATLSQGKVMVNGKAFESSMLSF